MNRNYTPELLKVIYLGFLFLLVFLAELTIMNLASQIYS
jgi:hypothetical protein